ncbi:hypothetical protein [Nesterenkonia sp. CF4.4]|uniref:hypothetical protein n=1 Tax=Nesterenkonia sp. CF4.4 TaxID=3373079 RepID=UPI003EE4EE59
MRKGLLTVGVILAGMALVAGMIWLVVTMAGDDPAPEEQAQTPQFREQSESSATPEPEPEPTDEPAEDAQEPDPLEDREQWEILAVEAAETMTTWTPAEDFNQTEAEFRASHLMTEERADEITAPERPTTGTEWLQAQEAGATSEPSVKVNRATSNEVVSVEATWEWMNPGGSSLSESPQRRIFYFNFEEDPDDGEAFLISDYSWETIR